MREVREDEHTRIRQVLGPMAGAPAKEGAGLCSLHAKATRVSAGMGRAGLLRNCLPACLRRHS